MELTSTSHSKRIAGGIGIMFGALLLFISGTFFGFRVGQNNAREVSVSEVRNIESTSTPANFGLFWDAWDLIDRLSLNNAKISSTEKVQGAISGLVGSLGDPYSEFFSPTAAKQFEEDVRGNFGGIGAEIGKRDGIIVIVSPLKDSPAQAAGLKPNDKILFIDATSTDGLGTDAAVGMIRGPIKTKVKLTIFRDGFEKPKEFEIERAAIQVPTLDYEMLPGNIAHIKLYGFNGTAPNLFYQAIRKAARANAQAVILDMRGDPGGYLDVAVDLAGWFLPRGTVVVKKESRNGIDEVLRANGNEALKDIPTVILLDGGSASASEILAGALRDNRGVKIVGEKSFGKGTVQELLNLPDGSTLKLTTAHWVMPSGRILDHDGIVPDYEVKLTEDNLKNNKDPQLAKAIEVIKAELRR